jgi:hypothetical protein
MTVRHPISPKKFTITRSRFIKSTGGPGAPGFVILLYNYAVSIPQALKRRWKEEQQESVLSLRGGKNGVTALVFAMPARGEKTTPGALSAQSYDQTVD